LPIIAEKQEKKVKKGKQDELNFKRKVEEKEKELEQLQNSHHSEKWQMVNTFLSQHQDLRDKLVEASSYRKIEKSIEENLKSPLIKAQVSMKIQEMHPNMFDDLNQVYELQIERKKKEIEEMQLSRSQMDIF